MSTIRAELPDLLGIHVVGLSRIVPGPSPRRRRRSRLPTSRRSPVPAAPVPDAAERESLAAQAAGKSTRQVQEMLAEVDPDLAGPPDRMRPLGAGGGNSRR